MLGDIGHLRDCGNPPFWCVLQIRRIATPMLAYHHPKPDDAEIKPRKRQRELL
ncbi:hypothetical protein [Burkholderia vietnamiensis]|jgi:hypothetical protein|uniref:Uncharacterized protein n=1 Tax=Burkholderia vietnamiensis TaxID=60552 RepID=A0ABS1AXW6_BURVI|nr:hypothetical protein [Burkholderia vietnamiensis]MBJ9688994.1 hypothetical protein [Burkholderia vietnamiensis]MBR8189949.1 hypothetical protein [Burkholderia vietnamiensis]MCA8267976.1 hypothetical protein [Burkholderia vietnamiensis]UKV75918.1 hypothetical protein FOC29_16195 [Burkholderia vietnamiensis]HDR8928895.1 hypothetical protein [Burkholderia vietnamiensis]